MKQLNFHILFAALTAAALGGGALAMAAHSAPTPEPDGPVQTFTRSDRNTFSSYETANGVCDAGFAPRDLCFSASPLEKRIVKGERFPEDMYALALEWRAKLALTRKTDGLKTVRIGQTIALMDRESRKIVDTMRLGGPPTAYAANERTG